MKSIVLLLIALAIPVAAHACTAFYQDDYVSGQNRICIYDHLGSDHIVTIKVYQVCRVTIRVAH